MSKDSRPSGAVSGKAKRKAAQKPAVQRVEPPDPRSKDAMRQLALRLGLPVLAVWVIGGCIAGVSQAKTTVTVALTIPLVITIALGGVVVWALRQAKKAKGVANLLSKVETPEDRKAA